MQIEEMVMVVMKLASTAGDTRKEPIDKGDPTVIVKCHSLVGMCYGFGPHEDKEPPSPELVQVGWVEAHGCVQLIVSMQSGGGSFEVFTKPNGEVSRCSGRTKEAVEKMLMRLIVGGDWGCKEDPVGHYEFFEDEGFFVASEISAEMADDVAPNGKMMCDGTPIVSASEVTNYSFKCVGICGQTLERRGRSAHAPEFNCCGSPMEVVNLEEPEK
jgi:hypothetical protein